MKRKIQKILLVPVMVLVMFSSASFISPTQANAQSVLCDLLPFLESIGAVNDALCTGSGSEAADLSRGIGSFIRFGLSLVFIGIIVVAIFYIIKSAIKYIRSEGDESKVEEATKAIKAVFIGVAALFVGVVGLVVIIALFGATGATNVDEDFNTDNEVIDNVFDGFFGD